ncbi:MAG: hypothetical protein QOG57_3209 [Pseudonocardiales bacterium]|nr:hypothetical protein [Pseudonocardiales bacterium]
MTESDGIASRWGSPPAVSRIEPRRPGRAGPTRSLPLVQEDHSCIECGLSYPQLTIEAAAEIIRSLPAAVRAAVSQVPADTLRRRPRLETWSALEYICHLRDVYITSTIRLHRARTEDRPALEPMLNDLRARRFRYNERALDGVLDELAACVTGVGEEINRLRPSDWERTVTRLPGEQRTAQWLLRQAAHEGQHHLQDIRDCLNAPAS